MKINKGIVAGFLACSMLFSHAIYASEITDKDKTVVTVNDKKITNQSLYDSIVLNSSYGPALEVLDMKFLSEKYKDDSRLQTIIDEKYAEVKEAYQEDDPDLKQEYASYGVSNKEDYLEKSGLILEAYRELAAIDTSYDKIFTKEEKDYVYKHKFSGTGKIYHIVISPKISVDDAMDETLLNNAKAEALKSAESVVADLDKGMSFQEAAKKYSDDKLTEDGYIGEYDVDSARSAGVDQSVSNAAFQLEDKKYTTNPVATKYGYEIVYIEYTKEKKTYDELKNDIAKKLYDLYQGNNQYITEHALMLFRDGNDISFNDTIMSREYANALIQARKSYVQYNPEDAANQYANLGY
ncbi:peptidylprolyl isomerase [Erysipelotrichaceae bacterium OttesenSCG-928-M19]|nr:peptidylprolyl isomerase [Erysipelotrichaceae bacterium OttesenSCG-928-M19]